jgi:hypothetical protein
MKLPLKREPTEAEKKLKKALIDRGINSDSDKKKVKDKKKK